MLRPSILWDPGMHTNGRRFPTMTKTAVVLVALAAAIASSPVRAQSSTANWAPVEEALGRKGAMQPGDVIKFSFPRSDLAVTVGGVTLKPALALGGWLAFKETAKGQAMAMGDLVLTDDEVGAVMRALQSGGVEQTALHNHLLNESPHVIYMHVSAHGDATKIARTLHDALALTRTPLGPAAAPSAPSAADLDTAGIADARRAGGRRAQCAREGARRPRAGEGRTGSGGGEGATARAAEGRRPATAAKP